MTSSSNAYEVEQERRFWRETSGYFDCCGMSKFRGHHELCPRYLSAAATNPLGAAPSAAGSASTAQHPEHMLAPKESRDV